MKKILPVIIIILALGLFFLLRAQKKPAEKKERVEMLPVVNVHVAEPQTFQLFVEANGVVRPAVETVLTAEVSGKIISVSPQFKEGKLLGQGSEILRLEAVDYEAARSQREADLAQAQLTYEQELALQAQARRDLERSGKEETSSDLALRIPQVTQAKARLESAQAALQLAEKNVARTRVLSPYRGRVLEKSVDVGQFVTAGVTSLGRLYDTSSLEVSLPLSINEFARLGIGYQYEREGESEAAPIEVIFRSTMPGDDTSWRGYVDRVDSVIDEQTQLLRVVTILPEPSADGKRLPKPGEFLAATLLGKTLSDVYLLPSIALSGFSEIYVVDENNMLAKRQVTILQTLPQQIVVADGVQSGDRVSTTPVDGSSGQVTIAGAE